MPRVNRYNLLQVLLENQLKYVGKTLLDAMKNPNYRNEWEIPTEDIEDFTRKSIPLIKKTLKINSNKARETFNWFLINYKLKEI